MERPIRAWLAFALTLGAALGAPPPGMAKEGFGFVAKKSTLLMRTTPPAVFLMGTRVAVKVGGVDGDGGLCQRLERQLESELLGRDKRLSAGGDAAQVLVEVNVLQNRMDERWEERTEIQSKKVGTDEKGKAIYKSYEVSVRYKVVTHNFSVAYKVTDLDKGASLDADAVEVPFEKAFREGNDAPVGFSLENDAITIVIDRIARRITPTREQIGVLLPKGRLADLAGLADAGLWSRYLEALEATSPSPNREDEAYRQYALGTAYEALGYESEDAATTLKYLEQADSFYNEAIGSKPDEKFFSKPYDSLFTDKTAAAPLERVRSALVSYRRIKDFQDNYDAMLAAAAATPAAGGKAVAGEADASKMDNSAVIRMTKAGLTEEIILTAIDTAPERTFDITPGGLIQLSDAKVGRKVIAHLQALGSAKNKSGGAKRGAAGSSQR